MMRALRNPEGDVTVTVEGNLRNLQIQTKASATRVRWRFNVMSSSTRSEISDVYPTVPQEVARLSASPGTRFSVQLVPLAGAPVGALAARDGAHSGPSVWGGNAGGLAGRTVSGAWAGRCAHRRCRQRLRHTPWFWPALHLSERAHRYGVSGGHAAECAPAR